MRIRASNIPVSLDSMLPGNKEQLKREIAKACGIPARDIVGMNIARKSIDARKKQNVHFVLTCELEISTEAKLHALRGVQIAECKGMGAFQPIGLLKTDALQEAAGASDRMPPSRSGSSPRTNVSRETFSGRKEGLGPKTAPRPVVVGAGPAGLFCALHLARAGLRPLLVERGESVENRARTVAAFNRNGVLDQSSNIQFGEGGAGTFSDGKLNTGTKDPRIRTVIEAFAECGAPPDILVDAKPHIGTDYLPTVVRNLRQRIIDAGGEVLFGTQLTGMEFKLNEDNPGVPKVRAAVLRDLKTGCEVIVPTDALVLAIGHSARDTYQMLQQLDMAMERKPFAVGVRIEHLQKDINRAQYGEAAGHPVLPPADYKLNVRTEDGRGVYTFCMCPGGTVVAAASEEGGVCVNGMSCFARDGSNANSALLVEIRPEDFQGDDVLAGMYFQRELEQAAYRAGDSVYRAPAQTVGSFLGSASDAGFGKVKPTYPCGVTLSDLHECLPPLIAEALEDALPKLDRKLHGFADPQAVMTAVESRSSSPVRILRDRQTLQSVSVAGIYPAGEGAGYAGGITSAAVDGLRVAEAIDGEHDAAYILSGRDVPFSELSRTNVSRETFSEENGSFGSRFIEDFPTGVKREEDRAIEVQLTGAVKALRAGYPAIFPTDTVMGIGVSVAAAESPAVLADIKGRPSDKPIAWLVGSLDDLDVYGEDVPEYARRLARQNWPGALTLVVKASSEVPPGFKSAEGTIGLRMPDSETTLRLICETGSPIAATSANLSGEPSPATSAELSEGFLHRARACGACLVALRKNPASANPSGTMNLAAYPDAAEYIDAADRPDTSDDSAAADYSGVAYSVESENPAAIPSTVVDCTGESPRILRE